jgi:hypothetical protein
MWEKGLRFGCSFPDGVALGTESFFPESPVPLPVPDSLGAPAGPPPAGEAHLVVVRSRPSAGTAADATGEIVTRYWHPRRRAWQEQKFESLEHAMHLFVEENGWVLRQQQLLDRAGAEELIFTVRLDELDQPSARDLLLDEVGLTPEDAEALLDRVDEQADRSQQ